MSASTALHFVVLECVQAQRGLVAGAALAVLGLGLMPAAQAQVHVSPSGNSGNTIAQPNTSDNVAVGPDGTIYVTYHGSNGVRVARSTDNGQSFGAPVTVTNTDFEAEIAVSSNGTVYVAWLDDAAGNSLMLAKSTDEAQTFGSPVDTGFSLSDNGGISPNPTVHFSADGDHLYFVGQTGQKVIVSGDGGSTFEKRSISQPSDRVFSDVLVDPTTRDVIAQFDDPSVTYAVSTDLGASFGTPKAPTPQPSVFFTAGAISTSDQGRFLLVAGQGNSLERVNLDNNNGTSTSIPASDASQGRSLAADGLGNVVTGYVESGGRTRANSGDVNTGYVRSGGATKATKASTGDVKFKVSTDAGETFGTATTVASASAAQADINRTNGDVMFLYENSGDILMRTFSDQLDGYGLTVSRSTIDFGDVPKGTSSGTESVTVTNETGGDVSISSIGTTSPFSVSNDNCPSTLGDTESCVVDVVFSPSSTGSFAEELEIATDQPNSPRTVGLQGKGAILDLAITDGSSSGLDFSESVSPGTDDNPVGIFELSAGQAGASLDGVTVTNKNPGVAGISAARLYWSSDQTLEPGTDTQLEHVSTDASSAPSTITFSGFSQSLPTSARYVIVAIDLQQSASADVEFELAQDGDLQTPGGEIAMVNGNSQSSFSALPLSNGAVALPVELTSFEATATRDGARLTWQTASETGNAGFEIQRRGAETGSWEQVGFRESKAAGGTTTEASTYRFADEALPYVADTLVYRLRQVDTDGSAQVTDPVRVARSGVSELKLKETYPNPARRRVTVRFAIPEEATSTSQSEATLRLYDVLGRQVQSVRAGAEPGRHETQLSVSDLASGVYVLRLRAGGTAQTRRLTVVR